MAATLTTDIPGAIPEVLGSSAYDTILGFQGAFTTVAQDYTDLEGAGGQVLRIPVLGPVTPATVLAQTVAATDDSLDITEIPVTVKELVKSIGWTDQAQAASKFDLSTQAGQRVGMAHAMAMEIDLKDASITGRNLAADVTIQTANPLRSYIVAAKSKIPMLLRQRGVFALLSQEMYDEIVQDIILQNSASFGDRGPIVDGVIPFMDGMTWAVVDDDAIPVIGGKQSALVVTKTTLVRAFSKRANFEPERDALARKSRIVGTQIFASGVVDDRGIVAAIRV